MLPRQYMFWGWYFSVRDSMSKLANPSIYDQRARVGRMMSRAHNLLVEALDKELEPFDVTAAQYVILSTLWAGRADTAAQMCKVISYSPGAMTRMIDRLEQKGIIRRSFHGDDRRSRKLELTSEGRKVFPKLFAASEAVIERFYGSFNARELDQFGLFLERMMGSG